MSEDYETTMTEYQKLRLRVTKNGGDTRYSLFDGGYTIAVLSPKGTTLARETFYWGDPDEKMPERVLSAFLDDAGFPTF
jgi:hypothetical protein